MAKKKTLTELQKKNKYNRISKMTCLLQYLSMVSPYIAIGIINYDEYFVQYNGVKVSISFLLAMVVMGLTVYGTTNDKFKDTTWSLMIKFLVLSFICFMLGSLISDLALIFLCGAIGLAGTGTLNKVSQNYKKKADLIKEVQAEVQREQLKEKIKKEESDIGSIL